MKAESIQVKGITALFYAQTLCTFWSNQNLYHNSMHFNYLACFLCFQYGLFWKKGNMAPNTPRIISLPQLELWTSSASNPGTFRKWSVVVYFVVIQLATMFTCESIHFLCVQSDLEQLRKIRRRSPHDDTEAFTVFLRSDVEAKYVQLLHIYITIQKFGSVRYTYSYY